MTCEERTRRSKLWHTLRYSEVTRASGQVMHFKIVEKL
eukprot:CAMPEP_0185905524 /NCGR_PEP_ID=MMETSP0196C-20130402/4734_1 /TAXON_ID=2932 /ORGANISM="Alexandrium fundyense, Strain CCMP1719" /LENGTH=37 /DNA_ID= /DNA_START= /DNA_END= /DNA_ORIENTATION=